MVLNSARWLYDRAKVLAVLKGKFSFAGTYKFGVDINTSCEMGLDRSILMDTYNEKLIYELVYQIGYLLDWMFSSSFVNPSAKRGVINSSWSLGGKVLHSGTEHWNLVLNKWLMQHVGDQAQELFDANPVRVMRNLNKDVCFSISVCYTCFVFDRGKRFEGSILMDRYRIEILHKHVFDSHSLFRDSIVLMSVKSSDYSDGSKMLMWVEFLRWKFKFPSTSLRRMRNGNGLNWVVIVFFGLPSSTVFDCGKCSFSWVENHDQLLRNCLYAKKEAKSEQSLCCYCCKLFNLRTKRQQSHPFSTSNVFSHGLYLVHPSFLVHQLLQPWRHCGVCYYSLLIDVLHIPSQEFTVLSELIYSRIAFLVYFNLPTCEVCESFSIHSKVLVGFSKLMVFYEYDTSQYSQLCYNYMGERAYQTEKSFCCSDRLIAQVMGAQSILTMLYIPSVLRLVALLKWKFRLAPIHILNLLMWFEYLRWKFKLCFTYLWNTRNVGGVNREFASVVCLDTTWYYLEDGVPWPHVYSLVTVSLVAERYYTLLKIKRGYRGVEICERRVESTHILILIKANGVIHAVVLGVGGVQKRLDLTGYVHINAITFLAMGWAVAIFITSSILFSWKIESGSWLRQFSVVILIFHNCSWQISFMTSVREPTILTRSNQARSHVNVPVQRNFVVPDPKQVEVCTIKEQSLGYMRKR